MKEIQQKDYNILSTATRMMTQSKLDTFDKDSETVPNQSLTVDEVLKRFSNGTLPNIVQPVYHMDVDDFDAYDITENPAFDLTDAENYKNQLTHKQQQHIKNKNESEAKQEKSLTTQKPNSDEQGKNEDEQNDNE